MHKLTGAVLSLFVIALYSQSPLRAEPSAELIARAKKDGRVTWYTDLIVNQIVRPLSEAFEAKYGVKLDYARGDSQDNLLKALNEIRAGRPVVDVVSVTTGMHSLVEIGAARRYVSEGVSLIPAHFRDPKGYWVAPNYFVMTPAVNTTMVKPQDIPKTYEDLLDPKWRGRMVWKPNDMSGAPGFIANVLLGMGEDKGMDYLRKLSGQNITSVQTSARAILNQVIAGEYPMALQVFNHHAVLSAAVGAPSQWVPLSPSAVTVSQVALIRGSPRQAAAELLVEFLISKEGQAIYQKSGYFPTHPDVPAPWPELSPTSGKYTANVIDPEIITRDLEKWNGIFKTMFR